MNYFSVINVLHFELNFTNNSTFLSNPYKRYTESSKKLNYTKHYFIKLMLKQNNTMKYSYMYMAEVDEVRLVHKVVDDVGRAFVDMENDSVNFLQLAHAPLRLVHSLVAHVYDLTVNLQS